MKLISIIIPTYNRADLIAETLDSLLNQIYQNWECIIIDDGSTDSSKTIIQKYVDSDARFSYFSRPDYKQKGPSSCRNFGIEKAKGEYILFLDSDDLISETCLENRVSFASQNPEFDFWIFKMQTFGYEQAPIFNYGSGIFENETEYCKQEFAKGNHPFVVTCPLWKKNVLINIKGFNENLLLFEDPELHLRTLKEGYKLKYANFEIPDCFYRLKQNNKKGNVIVNLKNNYIFFQNHLQSNDSNSILYYKKVLNEIILKKVLIRQYFKFYELGLEKKVLLSSSAFYGIILLFYHAIGLYKIKGIGYNYFKSQFNNF